jgi:hyaluronan synthase
MMTTVQYRPASVGILAGKGVPSGRAGTDRWTWIIRGAIFLGFASFVAFGLAGPGLRPILQALEATHWSRMFALPSRVWGALGMAVLGFRTLLWFRYRPFPLARPDSAPSLTVVIPAYNEGAEVGEAIDSVARAEYPRDRLQIIAVDDGSRDDTWEHVQAACARHPGRVQAVRFPANRGKRAALAEGIRRARGEILVTIDSDSVIERRTLLAIAGPFRDPKVGAVAGKVVVKNRRGMLPRMLHVRFIIAFDFLRAAQSTYGTVYCCPGALSAYRMKVVRAVLQPWLEQTFLGQSCTIGEDRALTNFILPGGYDTVYQRPAVVHTTVPSTYQRLCRMYLRWDRSFIREELHLVRIVWRRPWRARLIAGLDTCMANMQFPVWLLGYVLSAHVILHHPAVLPRMLELVGVVALLNTLYYLHSERSWNFLLEVLYGYFFFFALFWIYPTAFFTLRSRSWMTR